MLIGTSAVFFCAFSEPSHAQCYSYECAVYYGYQGARIATPLAESQLRRYGFPGAGYAVRQAAPYVLGAAGPLQYQTTPRYIPQPGYRYYAPAYGTRAPSFAGGYRRR